MSSVRVKVDRAKRKLSEARAASGAGAAWSIGQSTIEPPPRQVADFLDKRFLIWVWNYLKVALTPRYKFASYDAPVESRPGIHDLPVNCRVSLAGDWGSGTENAYRVMDHIRKFQQPQITIHLGDIYYSGQVDEVQRYFLGKDDWYRAERSFALNANHEMYSGGKGYFEYVLKELGQGASYFCIENEYWRIVAVDTGYFAKVIPFIELLLQTKLHRKNRKWLEEVVFGDDSDRRPVLLLSHHQWFSSFDKGYSRIGNQLKPFLRDVALWFYGHEHRLAGYAAHAPSGDYKVRTRCVGHGGMPVEIKEPKNNDLPLVFVDNREQTKVDGEPTGFCGNALLEFEGARLVVRYYDETGEELLAEGWTSNGRTGGVTGTILNASQHLKWFREPNELVR
jgi:hypothetical protein